MNNPPDSRSDARECLIRAVAELDDALKMLSGETGAAPAILSARSFVELARDKLSGGRPTDVLPRPTLEVDRPKS